MSNTKIIIDPCCANQKERFTPKKEILDKGFAKIIPAAIDTRNHTIKIFRIMAIFSFQ